jgi:hypothetical protein
LPSNRPLPEPLTGIGLVKSTLSFSPGVVILINRSEAAVNPLMDRMMMERMIYSWMRLSKYLTPCENLYVSPDNFTNSDQSNVLASGKVAGDPGIQGAIWLVGQQIYGGFPFHHVLLYVCQNTPYAVDSSGDCHVAALLAMT